MPVNRLVYRPMDLSNLNQPQYTRTSNLGAGTREKPSREV